MDAILNGADELKDPHFVRADTDPSVEQVFADVGMVLWRGSAATFPEAETRPAVAPDDWRRVLALARTVPELNPETNADGAADRARRGRSIRGLRDETLEHEADGMVAAPHSARPTKSASPRSAPSSGRPSVHGRRRGNRVLSGDYQPSDPPAFSSYPPRSRPVESRLDKAGSPPTALRRRDSVLVARPLPSENRLPAAWSQQRATRARLGPGGAPHAGARRFTASNGCSCPIAGVPSSSRRVASRDHRCAWSAVHMALGTRPTFRDGFIRDQVLVDGKGEAALRLVGPYASGPARSAPRR
ncbi:MAG TPA: hypothetical protein VGE72_27080 [Azospirillum sp.]